MPSYPWQRLVEQADRENDVNKLQQRITDAEMAIVARMQELAPQLGQKAAQSESEAMRSSMGLLSRMKSERLGWPTIGNLFDHP
jgi:hypothetical protein